MALNRRTTSAPQGTSNYVNLEEREYDARLVYVADLGIQEGQFYQGKQKPDRQQVALGFELIGEFFERDGEEWPKIMWAKPFNIFSDLTEKGKELEYYRYFEPKAKAGDDPDWEAQLGKPVSILVENTEKDGNVYDNIASISAIPEKYRDAVENHITAASVGDADDPNNPCTRALTGLPKYVFDRRLGQPEDGTPKKDDVPY